MSVFVQNCRLVKHFNLWASFLFILACDYKKMWVVTQQTNYQNLRNKNSTPKENRWTLEMTPLLGCFRILKEKKGKSFGRFPDLHVHIAAEN